MLKTDKTLDIQGVTGPTASAMTEQTLNAMEPGQVLRVITNDRKAGRNVMALCERLGHRILELSEGGGTLAFTIRKHTPADGP